MNLKPHILKILNGAPAKGMALPYLRIEVGVRTGGRPGAAALEDAITELKDAGLVEDAGKNVSDDVMVKITAKGRKEAAIL